MRQLRLLSCLFGFLMVAGQVVEARQFRQLAPIPVAPQVLESSGVDANSVQLSPGDPQLMNVENLSPIEQASVESAIADILNNWNTEGLEDYLDQFFPNRFQLLTVLRQDIPKDATLQLLSVQNVSTLSQVWGNQSQPRSRISSVIATVSLRLRFVDPYRGQITLPHTARFYLRVVESE